MANLGFDRANYTAASGAIDVQLADGTVTKFTDALRTTVAGTDTLRSIELITGTQFSDTFNAVGFDKDSTNAGSTQGGNATSNPFGTFNEFEGRGGNDIIVGNGSTRVSYLHATAGVVVTFTSWTGDALGASGQASGNVSVGQDTFSGVNSVRGSYFADEFYGSNNLTGVEVFEGRGGNDFIDGRGGFDRASYLFDDSGDNSGIIVSLAAGTVTGGIQYGN